MISYLLNSLIIGSLFAEMLERRFPEQFRNFFINLSYNCIYYYGKLQILFIKYIATNPLYLKVIDAIDSKTKNTSTNNELEFLFIKNNHRYSVPIDLPELIITSDVSKKPVSKRITYKGSYKDVSFAESDIKFILVEFVVGEKTYKIDLKTDEYNYYMIGNEFTKKFFIYYINEHLLSKYEQHDLDKNDKYSLKIIDNNVISHVLDFTDKNESIELGKDGYTLIYFLKQFKKKLR